MPRSRYLIVTAGGTGSRMGAPVPKQFIMLSGRPVLQITIERFVSAVPDIKVITVLPEDYIPVWKQTCYDRNFAVPQSIVHGGFTRFHSVRNALEKVPDGSLVAIHDGVRPFISRGRILSLFDLAEEFSAVVPVVPCVDTLRPMARVQDRNVLKRTDDAPVDRSRVFAVQTPQIFHSEIIRSAYAQPYDTSFTDDASVAEKAGVDVVYTDGDRFNIKLTTPDDLLLAEALLSGPLPVTGGSLSF